MLNEHTKYLTQDIRDYCIHWVEQIPYGIRAEIPCVSVIELLEFLAKSLMGSTIGGLANFGISMLSGSVGAIGFVVPELHGERVLENKGEKFDEKNAVLHIKQSLKAALYGTTDIWRGRASRRDLRGHTMDAILGESLAYLPASYTVHLFLENYGPWGLLTLPASVIIGGIGIAFTLGYREFQEQKQLAELRLQPDRWEGLYELAGDIGYNPQKRNENKFSIQLKENLGYANRGSLLRNLVNYFPMTNPSGTVRLYVPDLRRNDSRKQEYEEQINPLILSAEKELDAKRLIKRYALCGVVRTKNAKL